MVVEMCTHSQSESPWMRDDDIKGMAVLRCANGQMSKVRGMWQGVQRQLLLMTCEEALRVLKRIIVRSRRGDLGVGNDEKYTKDIAMVRIDGI